MIKVNGVKVLKKCTICKRHLPYSCFPHNKSRSDGYECFCRDCNLIKASQWREKNRKRMNEIVYASMARYPDRIRARYIAKYYHPNTQVCSVEGCLELGERHHDDYNKPREIIWVCKKHHYLANNEV